MKFKLTAVFRKVPGGYAALVEELPGANTQGKTSAEAVQMVLETNRHLAEDVIREPFKLTAA